jgi:2-polyprenyl-3-methyl-5-hydroxy-6-metoxy-1,4-benzoquinol methylase
MYLDENFIVTTLLGHTSIKSLIESGIGTGSRISRTSGVSIHRAFKTDDLAACNHFQTGQQILDTTDRSRIPIQKDWLDVGCGTGALSQIIFEHTLPNAIKGIDSSADFVTYAKSHVDRARETFEVGDIQTLQIDSASFDVWLLGLC